MAQATHRALVVEGDEAFRAELVKWLSDGGYQASVAGAAAEGAALLQKEKFDLLLLDNKLLDADGDTLIHRARGSGGSPAIIVCGAGAKADEVIRVWHEGASDFLPKPFKVEELTAALERASQFLRTAAASHGGQAAGKSSGGSEHSVRPVVAKLAENLKKGAVTLPVLDPNTVKLTQMLSKDQNVTVQELANVALRDTNLAAAILRRANSAAFARGKEITSLYEACSRLGSHSIIALGLEVSVGGRFPPMREPFGSALKGSWKNAIAASRIAPLLAERLRLPDREELQLITLFHNLGEVLSISLLAELDRTSGKDITAEQLAVEVEASHEEFGRALAASWKLPAAVVRVAGFHHRPSSEPEAKDEQMLRNVVLASWAIALRAGLTYFPGQETVDPKQFLEIIGLGDDVLESMTEQIKKWEAQSVTT